jgi:hypothetical protein
VEDRILDLKDKIQIKEKNGRNLSQTTQELWKFHVYFRHTWHATIFILSILQRFWAFVSCIQFCHVRCMYMQLSSRAIIKYE